MDVAAASIETAQGELATEVGVSLLRTQLDTQTQGAAQLLQALPRPTLEPDKGARFDAYA